MLIVRPGVFIPRPETELLVERASSIRSRDLPAPVVVDVGTGTGAIALAVADERPDARVFAIDDSRRDAVALARENAAALGLSIEVLEGDLLAPLPASLRGGVGPGREQPARTCEPDELAALARRRCSPTPSRRSSAASRSYERLFAQAMPSAAAGRQARRRDR